uniref:Uncharacterized protein n=1 Tax=Lates calcarifer TaxID=8187 RepID=A0A4W6GAY1_LATCA
IAGSSLSCRWMDHKFRQYSENSLDLLDTMVNNSTNSTEDAEVEDTVAFPNDLYSQASKASAEDKLGFTVQVLEEMAVLFEEDHSAVLKGATEDRNVFIWTQRGGSHPTRLLKPLPTTTTAQCAERR